jgi:flagellar L-ring protein precursor FlgH
MKPTRAITLIGALAMLAQQALAQIPPDAENPGSLFPKTYVNPFLDRTARQAGDILTILISESSTASFSAATTASKKDGNAIAKLIGPDFLTRLFPNLGTGATSTTDGKGNTNQAGRVSARMTAVVKSVLPNGNLVIEGIRMVRVNKEEQVFFLSGIVRRDDIRPDNTILSESLANAEIRLDGTGQISDRTRRGILTKILDWLF